jgi:hypothetical protein
MPTGARAEAVEVTRSPLLSDLSSGLRRDATAQEAGPKAKQGDRRGAGDTCIMSSRAEALRQLETGLRLAAEAVAKLLPRNRRHRNPPHPPNVPDGSLTEIDRFRARAAARRCGLKVLKP